MSLYCQYSVADHFHPFQRFIDDTCHVLLIAIFAHTALCCYREYLRGPKVFKSKGPVFAQFCLDFENSTSGWSKTVKRFGKKYSHQIFVKNVALVGKNTCWACQRNLKFYSQVNYLMPRKKTQNNLFLVWGAHHCENGI